MALTISVVERRDVGMAHEVIADITFDASYPTGGEALTGGDLGMRVGKLHTVAPVHEPVGKRVQFVPNADGQQGLLKLFLEDGASGIHAEAGNTTDQSAVTVRVKAVGR